MHCLHNERDNREKRIQQLKEEMTQLNSAIVFCQEKLPATGAPVTRQVCVYDRSSVLKAFFPITCLFVF